MSRTYSEQRQAILFKASRDLRKVAIEVLDDVQSEAELTGRTPPWAKSLCRVTAELANEMEERGHELCIAPSRANTELHKSHAALGAAIVRFEERLEAHGVNPASID